MKAPTTLQPDCADRVKTAQGYRSDYNVFLEGAKKSSFGDDNSAVAADVTRLAVEDHPHGATITFSIGDAPLRVNGPRVDAELVGVFATVAQTIEDRDGNPIAIGADVNGKAFSRAIPGPLANLQRGENTITWSMGKQWQATDETRISTDRSRLGEARRSFISRSEMATLLTWPLWPW